MKTVETRNGEKHVHSFNLTDRRCSIKVSAGEDMIATTNEMFEMDIQQPTVIILASVRLHMLFCEFLKLILIKDAHFTKQLQTTK